MCYVPCFCLCGFSRYMFKLSIQTQTEKYLLRFLFTFPGIFLNKKKVPYAHTLSVYPNPVQICFHESMDVINSITQIKHKFGFPFFQGYWWHFELSLTYALCLRRKVIILMPFSALQIILFI